MDKLYRWRVQEKNRQGRVRWRLMRAPMTEETARFWAANNHKVIERIDLPVTAPHAAPQPAATDVSAFKGR